LAQQLCGGMTYAINSHSHMLIRRQSMFWLSTLVNSSAAPAPTRTRPWPTVLVSVHQPPSPNPRRDLH
jgi:hypothetical protein